MSKGVIEAEVSPQPSFAVLASDAEWTPRSRDHLECCNRIGSVPTLSKLGKARAKKLRELNKCVVEFHSRCGTVRHFSAALKKNH